MAGDGFVFLPTTEQRITYFFMSGLYLIFGAVTMAVFVKRKNRPSIGRRNVKLTVIGSVCTTITSSVFFIRMGSPVFPCFVILWTTNVLVIASLASFALRMWQLV